MTSHDELIRALSTMTVDELLRLTRSFARRLRGSAAPTSLDPFPPSKGATGGSSPDDEYQSPCTYCDQHWEDDGRGKLYIPWTLERYDSYAERRFCIAVHRRCLLEWPHRAHVLKRLFPWRSERLVQGRYWALAHGAATWAVFVGGWGAPAELCILFSHALQYVHSPIRDWSRLERRHDCPPAWDPIEADLWHQARPEIFEELPSMGDLLKRTNWTGRMRRLNAERREADALEQERRATAQAFRERHTIGRSIALKKLAEGPIPCPYCRFSSSTHRVYHSRLICRSCGRSFEAE